MLRHMRHARGLLARRLSRCSARLILVVAAAQGVFGCDPDAPGIESRPSFLLVVIDTLRADAVSAYGEVTGTTPHLDALAADGLLYTHAFAPAPWTLPSHATLFTGLGPERHGVGLHGRMKLPAEQVTLAERLRAAGYQTASFSENLYISRPFGMTQGFETFYGEYEEIETFVRRRSRATGEVRVEARVKAWVDALDPDRPFFLFVNLFDPHDPYTVRPENPWVPEDASLSDRDLRQAGAPPEGPIAWTAGICDRLPDPETIAALRGLYLGDVAAADAKLAEVLKLVRGASRRLVVVATSDHGEHFGEHALLGHEFSVRNPVLHVPLVVHGLPGVEPARLDTPVTLADVPYSMLSWAGLEVPAGLSGRLLPTRPGDEVGRALVAAFTDSARPLPEESVVREVEALEPMKRQDCRERHKVFGDTFALTRYPYKLVWFEHHPAELYDLSWDANEGSDRSAYEPERRAALERELRGIVVGSMLEAPGETPELDPLQRETMRALGYVE
jgi:arylsulfatase A-like enzyme